MSAKIVVLTRILQRQFPHYHSDEVSTPFTFILCLLQPKAQHLSQLCRESGHFHMAPIEFRGLANMQFLDPVLFLRSVFLGFHRFAKLRNNICCQALRT